MSNSFDIGRLSFEVPADCPQPSVFESVVREEYRSSFGADTSRGAFCKSEYDRCQDVHAPFDQNPAAAAHYQRAQMALSPGAKKWEMFEYSACQRFSDIACDGDKQQAAIPGWDAGYSLKVSVKDRPQEQVRQADQGQAKGRGRER